jgi:hypothetical protein
MRFSLIQQPEFSLSSHAEFVLLDSGGLQQGTASELKSDLNVKGRGSRASNKTNKLLDISP